MKKLAKWLSEHAVVLGSGEKDSVVHLWCILISFVLTFVFALCGLKGAAMYYLLMILLLGGSIIPPIAAAIIAICKDETWNPWYWFPVVIGNAIGCAIACAVCYIFNIV